VVRRAWDLLAELESKKPLKGGLDSAVQLDLFSSAVPEVNTELLGLDLDNMSPLDALSALYRLRQKAQANETE
jgi:DNA mismatch repair protein MutS